MSEGPDDGRPEAAASEPPGRASDPHSQHPAPVGHDHVSHTAPLPRFQQSSPSTASAPTRRSGTLTATVLIGALLLGGAAGVGGAAWYDAWRSGDATGQSSGSSTPADTSAPVRASSAVAPSTSVEKVAARVLPSVVKINVQGAQESGSGSGIVLTRNGDILTNNHVAAVAGRGGSISVSFNDGRTAPARVVGTDPVTDTAVIHAEHVTDLSPARIGDSGTLKVGQPVVAVGSPYGLNATVTSGIVSALDRPVSVAGQEQSPPDPFGAQQRSSQDLSTTYPAIQTDAAINPGNSGGPLVDMSGRVVGINSSIRTAGGGMTGSGGSIGLGFAIPIDEVLPIVNQLLKGETPTHARLGVTVTDASGSALEQGAIVRAVDSGGAAARAGLRPGDRITKVDGHLVSGAESLVATVRGHRPGDSVPLTYVRSGSTRTADITLGSDANNGTS